MVVYSIRCDGCGKKRAGREKDGDVQPYRDACPNCDETDYTVPGKG